MQKFLKEGFHLDWTARNVGAILDVKSVKTVEPMLTLVAQTLNEAGYSVIATIKHVGIEGNWTTMRVKEFIWRPIQASMYRKESTTELEKTGEIEKIHDNIMRELGEKWHIEYHEFPHDKKKAQENNSGYKTNAGQTPKGVEYPEYTGEPTI